MKIVCFEWKDAFGNGGWFDKTELKAVVEDVNLWVHTTGFLVKKTKRELIVCTTWQPANSPHRVQEKFCNLHKIPITWIRNYRVLGHTVVIGCKGRLDTLTKPNKPICVKKRGGKRT